MGQSWVTLKFGGFTKTKMFDSITIWLPSRKSSSDTDTRWTIEPPSAEALGFRCYPVWPQGDGFCRWSQTPIFIFLEALKSFYLFYAGAVSLALAVWPRSCFRWGLDVVSPVSVAHHGVHLHGSDAVRRLSASQVYSHAGRTKHEQT